MSLTDYIYKRFTFFKLILLTSAIFTQNCSNDERLEGLRQPVLLEQKVYETNKNSQKLALGKPKNVSSWTHSGGGSSHSLGNIAFSAEGNFSSHSKVRVGPRGSYSEPLFKIIRFFDDTQWICCCL